MGCASLRSDVLPPFKSGGSTSGIGCSYLCNRAVPPLMVLLPLHPFYPPLKVLLPQNPGPSTTESELLHRNSSCSTSEVVCSYFCNRVVPPLKVLLPQNLGPSATESELPHRNPSRSTSGIRSVPPPNPSCSSSGIGLSHHLIRHAT